MQICMHAVQSRPLLFGWADMCRHRRRAAGLASQLHTSPTPAPGVVKKLPARRPWCKGSGVRVRKTVRIRSLAFIASAVLVEYAGTHKFKS